MIKKLLFLSVFIIFSCSEEKKESFSLTGKTDKLENQSTLYLHDLVNNKTLDSAIVKNGQFQFDKELPNYPFWAIIHTKDRSINKDIWIEDKTMTLDATNTVFSKAKITGSESNKLITELYENVDFTKRKELKEKEKEFIEQHPESIISAFLLSGNLSTWGLSETKRLFQSFPETNKISHFGEKISIYVKTSTAPEIGEDFLDISMENPDGEIKKLSDLKGKVILLEYWAAWCLPCRKDNPELVKIYNEYHSKGFEIYAVSLDRDKDNWVNAINQDNLEWTHVSDLQKPNKAAKLYGVTSIPDSFLIGRDGKLIENKLRGDDLRKKLDEIFTK
ncbi:peroxiredoxin [Gillisia mitskevichiae]|uniref:Peroxiredoxin n=1 Tax=Gillisia mitskevichiae TaxID=270921 RepID=A0A495NWJ2_9FLAO|nr:TlpA disulfide reductase family protein [Gillisia mitskevichiae]RKS42784.1 peroxiredoxin [Gillisia mitskevichiae]